MGSVEAGGEDGKMGRVEGWKVGRPAAGKSREMGKATGRPAGGRLAVDILRQKKSDGSRLIIRTSPYVTQRHPPPERMFAYSIADFGGVVKTHLRKVK
jgi:hypothetical protein